MRDDPVSLTPRPCDLPYLTVMLQAAYALAAFLPLELFGV
ncbi:putative membrane protein [Yersinia pestis PY-101]|nr:putative membrane protein [Yersinia pestis PY-101]